MPYGSTYHQIKYSLPFGKWRMFEEKEIWRIGQRHKRIRQKCDRPRQKTKRLNIEKWDQLATLRFQTRGRHRKCPGLPLGREEESQRKR